MRGRSRRGPRQRAFTADARSGSIEITDGPYARGEQYIGGLTIVDVADEERARYWARRIAEACGWPQETPRLY